MAESIKSAEDYRQRAADMKAQAQRAETVYLQALYASIADNWDQLAEQMRAAEQRQERASDNWETPAEDMAQEAAEDPPVPPPPSNSHHPLRPQKENAPPN